MNVPPTQSPPAPPKQRPIWLQVLIALGVFVVGLPAMIFGIGAAVAVFDAAQRTPVLEPQIERIAIRQNWEDLMICTSTNLHQCRIKYGSSSGVDLNWVVLEIVAPASCDEQASHALAACQASGQAGGTAYDTCMARAGVLGRTTGFRGDIRDGHLPAGNFEMHCVEGMRDGHFETPAF